MSVKYGKHGLKITFYTNFLLDNEIWFSLYLLYPLVNVIDILKL